MWIEINTINFGFAVVKDSKWIHIHKWQLPDAQLMIFVWIGKNSLYLMPLDTAFTQYIPLRISSLSLSLTIFGPFLDVGLPYTPPLRPHDSKSVPTSWSFFHIGYSFQNTCCPPFVIIFSQKPSIISYILYLWDTSYPFLLFVLLVYMMICPVFVVP